MESPEIEYYQPRRSKAVLTTAVLLAISALIIASPLSYLYTSITGTRDLSFIAHEDIDANEDGLYDSFRITVGVPQDEIELQGVILKYGAVTVEWEITSEAILLKGRSNFTISVPEEGEEISPNYKLGMLIIFRPTDTLDKSYILFRFTTEMLMPDARFVIGVYFNETDDVGWIEREYRKLMYDVIRSEINALNDEDIKIIRLTKSNVEKFLELSEGTQNWIIFTTDVIPESIVPIRNATTRSLKDFLLSGGNIAFSGGDPLRYTSDDSGKIRERFELMDETFDTNLPGIPDFITGVETVIRYNKLGKLALNRTEDTSYLIAKGLNNKAVDYHKLNVTAFGGDGVSFFDPVYISYENGREVVFSRLSPIDDKEFAVDTAEDVSDILKYVVSIKKLEEFNLSSKEFDFDKDGQVDHQQLVFDKKKNFDNILSVRAAVNGAEVIVDDFQQSKITGENESLTLELSYQDQFEPGITVDFTFDLDFNFDGLVDKTVRSNVTTTTPEVLDTFIYSELTVDDSLISSYVQTKFVQAQIQGSSGIQGSSILFEGIIENQRTDISIIVSGDYIPASIIDGSNPYKAWLENGGEIFSVGYLPGNTLIDGEVLIGNEKEVFLSYYDLSVESVKFNRYTVHELQNWGNLYSFNNYSADIAIDTSILYDRNITIYSGNDRYASSFSLNVGLGKLHLVYGSQLTASVIDDVAALVSMIRSNALNPSYDNAIDVQIISAFSSNSSDLQYGMLKIRNGYNEFLQSTGVFFDGSPVYTEDRGLFPGQEVILPFLVNSSLSLTNNSIVSLKVDFDDGKSVSDNLKLEVKTNSYVVVDSETDTDGSYTQFASSTEDRDYPYFSIISLDEILKNYQSLTVVLTSAYVQENLLSNGNSSALIKWIQAGGKIIVRGPDFGLNVISNGNKTALTSNAIFSTNPYVVTPGILHSFNTSAIDWISPLFINTTSLGQEGFGVRSHTRDKLNSGLVELTGSGNIVDLGLGKLYLFASGNSVAEIKTLIDVVQEVNL